MKTLKLSPTQTRTLTALVGGANPNDFPLHTLTALRKRHMVSASDRVTYTGYEFHILSTILGFPVVYTKDGVNVENLWRSVDLDGRDAEDVLDELVLRLYDGHVVDVPLVDGHICARCGCELRNLDERDGCEC